MCLRCSAVQSMSRKEQRAAEAVAELKRRFKGDVLGAMTDLCQVRRCPRALHVLDSSLCFVLPWWHMAHQHNHMVGARHICNTTPSSSSRHAPLYIGYACRCAATASGWR